MYKRGVTWWTCIRYKGKKLQRSLETSSKTLARDIETKIRNEILEGNYFNKSTGTKKNVTDMLGKFMEEHSPNVAVNTQKSYKTSLNHLIPFFGDYIVADVSHKDIAVYKTRRKNTGAKTSSLNRELAMLSKAFTLAVKEWEWIAVVPKISMDKENNERDNWLKADEEERLLDLSPAWLKDLIIFALNTGLRQDEQTSLEWIRVDLIYNTILIQETKTGKPRTIPLNQTAINILEKKGQVKSIKNDFVFRSMNGTKINNCNLIRAFHKAKTKAEIKDFTWHGLRRTFATRLVQRGIDIYKVAKLLGHEDVKMTQQRYAHHCPDSLRGGVEILDSDYNLTTIGQKQAISGA